MLVPSWPLSDCQTAETRDGQKRLHVCKRFCLQTRLQTVQIGANGWQKWGVLARAEDDGRTPLSATWLVYMTLVAAVASNKKTPSTIILKNLYMVSAASGLARFCPSMLAVAGRALFAFKNLSIRAAPHPDSRMDNSKSYDVPSRLAWSVCVRKAGMVQAATCALSSAVLGRAFNVHITVRQAHRAAMSASA